MHWRDYKESNDSWEPLTSILQDVKDIVDEYFQRIKITYFESTPGSGDYNFKKKEANKVTPKITPKRIKAPVTPKVATA